MLRRVQLFVNWVSRAVLRRVQHMGKLMQMKLGTALKEIRDEARMTQDDLAERAGTTKSSVSRIENEEQVPSLDMLERLAAALGVKVYQVMARAEGSELPVSKASKEERELLRELKAMEPDVREHYLAIARGLAKK